MDDDTGLTRPTTASPRKFGLLIGGACAILSAWLAWRGRAAAPWVLGAGGLLVGAAAVVPAALRPLEAGWMWMAQRLGRVGNTVLLTVFFFLILSPFALVLRVFGRDRLAVRSRGRDSYWVPCVHEGERDYSKPF
jgi:hypothetical protein